ncbi:SDR family NAD(P)-dependent oxidoreductase [Arthrobacter sp. MMS18-M83]|uniref:SDR family NAD(P)-dependent oxidoreductase n=1 Tax=Arthrobacter sp. MMS18-M83 TaxID=2996261 RepID=UPI00227BF821|nr:SDR family NAD(P)-dependent oxidoreductase [Arthrobacter sp. MMS18-M83]WAH96239.1 SDR family NAD(P)-dependent oxidoreductase [Arthrobacter sp. MMS18-M83]
MTSEYPTTSIAATPSPAAALPCPGLESSEQPYPVSNSDPTGAFWKGKAAVITGAAGGMGALETARILQAGGTVFAVDVLALSHESWDRLQTAAGEHRPRLVPYTADIRRAEAWDNLKAEIAARKVPVHGLVNNAGITLRKTLTQTEPEEWDRLIGINLTGSFLAIRALAPVMSDGGSIVNISSSAGLVGYFGAAYSASKWGLRGVTKAAAIELASRRIRVNSICPGLVDSDMTRKPNAVYDEEQAAAFYEECRQSTPFGRGAHPEEVADLVMFLLGPQSSYITGTDIPVDGGMVAGGIYSRVGRAAGSIPEL